MGGRGSCRAAVFAPAPVCRVRGADRGRNFNKRLLHGPHSGRYLARISGRRLATAAKY